MAAAIGTIHGLIDVPLELGHEPVMDSLAGFSTAAVDALELVADVAVVVFLSQLSRGTVR